MRNKLLLVSLLLLLAISVLPSNCYSQSTDDLNRAKNYMREAEYYQRKASDYMREAEYYLERAVSYEKDVKYYSDRGDLSNAQSKKRDADDARDSYATQIKNAKRASETAADYMQRAINALR